MQKFINLLFMGMLLCALTVVEGYAQVMPSDSISQKTAAQNLETYFNKAIKEQSRLFNGSLYQFYLSNITGSAYFKDSEEFTKGSVIYDGFLYEDVPLLYDLYRDIVVSKLYDGNSKFSLVKEKVTEFQIDEHRFVYLNKDSIAERTILQTGFYDLLYNGKIKVFAKRGKIIEEVNEVPYQRKFFVSKDSYYLEKDKVIYQIGKEGSFLKLFKNEKAEMRKHLKNNSIKFKEAPEQAMVLLAKYYDSLPN